MCPWIRIFLKSEKDSSRKAQNDVYLTVTTLVITTVDGTETFLSKRKRDATQQRQQSFKNFRQNFNTLQVLPEQRMVLIVPKTNHKL